MLAGVVAGVPLLAQSPAPKPVSADAATLRRLAIAVAPARAMTQAQTVSGFARVLDPLPLAQLDSDIAAAAPAASASAAEAARSQALFRNDVTVSKRAADTASSQARGDASRLALLRRRLGLEWGPAIARMSDRQRGALVRALADGRTALVRIDSAGGSGQAGLRGVTIDLGVSGQVHATILGPARAADPRLQSPGLIARIDGNRAALFSTGLTAPAKLGGAVRSGIFVPAGSALRLSGATWAYVQRRPGLFERRRLDGVLPVPGGLFASHGIQPGEATVTRGASALYAAEQAGAAAAE